MGTFEIREMRHGDIPAILRLEYLSFPTPWTEWMFASQLKLADISVNIVLADEEGIAGYAIAWIAYDEIHLLSIAVTPEKRRRGYGRALLEEVVARGRARGGSRVILEVREKNSPARGFYKAMKFSDLGKRRGYYIDTGEDAYVMELVLETEEREGTER
jgi:ribosomal-protein-alanine N-acetyltransferase